MDVKSKSLIALSVSFIALVALVFWQVQQANANNKIYLENVYEEVSKEVLNIAARMDGYERLKNKNDDLFLQNNYLDSVFKTSKIIKDLQYTWNIDSIKPENLTVANITYDKKLSVCISCLVTINVENDSKNSKKNDSFTLINTPSEIRAKRADKNTLFYVNFFYKHPLKRYTNYILPLFFITAIFSTLLWLLQLNAKQRRLIQQKNEFVNHLSHQFQTPLSSIKMSSNLLLKNNDIEKEPLIKIIQKESNRLEHHIKTVLHWVKSDSDRLHLNLKKVRVTEVIENCITQMSPIFLSTQTSIEFTPPDTEQLIYADEEHLQLMLFNIWENSIKHNTDVVKIKVSITINSKTLKIISSDDGKGVQHTTTSIKYKGLGLSYIDKIMTKHSGNMQIQTNDKGFTILLSFKKYEKNTIS